MITGFRLCDHLSALVVTEMRRDGARASASGGRVATACVPCYSLLIRELS